MVLSLASGHTGGQVPPARSCLCHHSGALPYARLPPGPELAKGSPFSCTFWSGLGLPAEVPIRSHLPLGQHPSVKGPLCGGNCPWPGERSVTPKLSKAPRGPCLSCPAPVPGGSGTPPAQPRPQGPQAGPALPWPGSAGAVCLITLSRGSVAWPGS